MTEDMRRAKVLEVYPKAKMIEDGMIYRIIAGAGKLTHLGSGTTPEIAWEAAAINSSRLKAEPVENEKGACSCGYPCVPCDKHLGGSPRPDCKTVPPKEAEGEGVEQPLSIPVENIRFVSEEYRQRLAKNGIQLKGFEPKEAAPESAGPLKVFSEELHSASLACNCHKTTRKSKVRLCSICESAWKQAWDLAEGNIGRTPEPATEGAPETIAAEGRLDDRFTFQVRRDIPKDVVYAGTKAGAYLMLKFPSKPREPKAEGAEKAPNNHGLGEYFPEDCKHDELVVKLSDADTLFHALETRNAELEKEAGRLTTELSSTSAALERDRTSLCGPLKAIREAIKCREWLRLGRGSFEWDDDRWRDEFGFAIDEILEAIEPLAKIAADWSNCPKHTSEVEAARIDWQTRALKAESSLAAQKGVDGFEEWWITYFGWAKGHDQSEDLKKVALAAWRAGK